MKAFEWLTPELRRRHKLIHDKAVGEEAERLRRDGYTILFVDLKNHDKPDIIVCKDREILLLDVKTRKGQLKVVVESKYNL